MERFLDMLDAWGLFLAAWLLLIGLAAGSILLRRRTVPCLVLAAVPALVSAGLLLSLLHDLRIPSGLPYADGIAITAVMRLFGLEDNVAVPGAIEAAQVRAVTMLVAAAVFYAVMLVVTLLKNRQTKKAAAG